MVIFYEFFDYILYLLIKNLFKMSVWGKMRGLGLKKVFDWKIWSILGILVVGLNKFFFLFVYCFGLLVFKFLVVDLFLSKFE